ncbi:hypothetical protein GOP47_0017168 [Adiantum capillus-veneris]|uniref:Pentatricopeptide repeat-containing protein n=1 Tax=Adiantum capillus-veneris TaxID=13818 RepID=A0A9D4UK07_ADICA|nr:hypothetical protein GOP47_0017168 [Adiantum capillus-veneris]
MMADKNTIKNYVSIVHKCRKCKDLDGAKHVYLHIRNDGLETHPVLGNYMVPMFADCGSMMDALEIFGNLACRNVFSYTYLILGYVHSEQPNISLTLYDRMKKEGVEPSSYTLVAVLKACARLLHIKKGQEIHNEILQKGFETDLLTGSTLTDMYAKNGSPFEAQKAFEKLHDHDIVLWNVLVWGYVDNGLDLEALKCYDKMQQKGLSPNETTFVFMLQACSNTGDVLAGQELHTCIVLKGFDLDLFVGNTLVNMYGKCGLLSDAQNMFEKLSVQNVVSWSALIDGYAEHKGDLKALELYDMMELGDAVPNVVTFGSIIKACTNLSALDRGRKIHSRIIQLGHDKEQQVSNSLMTMYVKCGKNAEAQKVFDMLPLRNVVSWNIFIEGLAQHQPVKEVVSCFDKMQREGVSPDVVAYASILSACIDAKDVDIINSLHTMITERGLEVESLVGSTLVAGYAKCGLLFEAQMVFEKVPNSNFVAWNALIAGYAEYGLGRECLDCFAKMKAHSIYASLVTYLCILKECGSRGLVRKGQEIHSDIMKTGYDVDPYVGNTLVDMYARCGSMIDSYRVFESLLVPDIVSWNALITGYAEYGPDQEALNCFERMQEEYVCEDPTTVVSVLKACGNVGAPDSAKDIHMKILYKGYENDPYLVATLIVAYAKCGSLAEAEDIFDSMAGCNVVLWNAMITGYGINHEAHNAIKIYENMRDKDVKPNEVTFLCLFTACSRTSRLDNGREFLKDMTEDYHILQRSDHFTSIVDLFARSGRLSEAEKFLETLPCSPSKDTWTALLNSCKNHVQAGAGTRCFQQLLHIQPDCASSYVLASKLYASHGITTDGGNICSNDTRREDLSQQQCSSLLEKHVSGVKALSELHGEQHHNIYVNSPFLHLNSTTRCLAFCCNMHSQPHVLF